MIWQWAKKSIPFLVAFWGGYAKKKSLFWGPVSPCPSRFRGLWNVPGQNMPCRACENVPRVPCWGVLAPSTPIFQPRCSRNYGGGVFVIVFPMKMTGYAKENSFRFAVKKLRKEKNFLLASVNRFAIINHKLWRQTKPQKSD